MLKSSGPLQGSPTSRLTGLLVRNARVAIGWSQRELARRAGVPQTAISRLERGLRCGLDLERLDRIVVQLERIDGRLEQQDALLLLAGEVRTLNESLNALAYAALGQTPQVRRRRAG